MRLGVWLLLPLSFGGCSGGYPLEPTRCDDLCRETQGPGCPEDYAPASCVVTCERSNLDLEQCRSFFDAVLTCYRSEPNARERRCDYFTPWDQRPCELEQQALAACVGFYGLQDGYEP